MLFSVRGLTDKLVIIQYLFVNGKAFNYKISQFLETSINKNILLNKYNETLGSAKGMVLL